MCLNEIFSILIYLVALAIKRPKEDTSAYTLFRLVAEAIVTPFPDCLLICLFNIYELDARLLVGTLFSVSPHKSFKKSIRKCEILYQQKMQ